MDTHQFTVSPEDSGLRLDKFLVQKMPSLSRNRIQALLEAKHLRDLHSGVTLIDPAAKVKPGQQLELTLPDTTPLELKAQDIALAIVYEDKDIIVIDKPAGMTVHPAPGHADGTLVNALLAHCGESLSGIGGVARPGIVHRIDKDTSGLLVVAKHDAAHAALSAQLADRSLSRVYKAIVWGALRPMMGQIEGAIGRSPTHRKKMAVVRSGGKAALTYYQTDQVFPVAGNPVASLITCKLDSGRTHQIRVHLTHKGHPLVGDTTYGAGRRNTTGKDTLLNDIRKFPRQALHAAELQLIHPTTGEQMRFTSSLPDDLLILLKMLGELK